MTTLNIISLFLILLPLYGCLPRPRIEKDVQPHATQLWAYKIVNKLQPNRKEKIAEAEKMMMENERFKAIFRKGIMIFVVVLFFGSLLFNSAIFTILATICLLLFFNGMLPETLIKMMLVMYLPYFTLQMRKKKKN